MQKAYDRVWRAAMWLTLWDLGIKGMWRVIKKIYEVSKSAVLLEGEKFSLEQGVAQGCISNIIFCIHR